MIITAVALAAALLVPAGDANTDTNVDVKACANNSFVGLLDALGLGLRTNLDLKVCDTDHSKVSVSSNLL